MLKAKKIVVVIVVAQFLCTSLWFASNAVMQELIFDFNLQETALSHLTIAVQFGFIIGTLLYAFFTITDRFAPSKVFFCSACLGALSTGLLTLETNTFWSLISLRFCTGFFLAGIYPVGMKIAADYYTKGLGKALGFLVGALVLGTAFPHLLNAFSTQFSWTEVMLSTSGLACVGGLLVLVLVPNGPFRTKGTALKPMAIFKVFQNTTFKKAAFGYFGHMWELYAFWTFVPLLISYYNNIQGDTPIPVALGSFIVIASGSVSCVLSGYISEKLGLQKTAFSILILSGICCLASPFLFSIASPYFFAGFLILWGMLVIADSPLFSTLVASNAEPEIKGTALTLVNSLGFAITILSIEILNILQSSFSFTFIFMVLAIGPIIGVVQWLKT